MTSLWSPKIDRPWQAIERAVTWKTVGSELAGDFVHVGDHQEQTLGSGKGGAQRRRWPGSRGGSRQRQPSDCIWEMTGIEPQMFSWPALALASASAAIGEDGVMG
jgi:hypothetical protein